MYDLWCTATDRETMYQPRVCTGGKTVCNSCGIWNLYYNSLDHLPLPILQCMQVKMGIGHQILSLHILQCLCFITRQTSSHSTEISRKLSHPPQHHFDPHQISPIIFHNSLLWKWHVLLLFYESFFMHESPCNLQYATHYIILLSMCTFNMQLKFNLSLVAFWQEER